LMLDRYGRRRSRRKYRGSQMAAVVVRRRRL
jgi:hypothetical protein